MTTPTTIADHESEVTALFGEFAPTTVGVVLAVAGFVITLALLGAVIGAVGKAVGGLGSDGHSSQWDWERSHGPDGWFWK
jgi:hypothetical protein